MGDVVTPPHAVTLPSRKAAHVPVSELGGGRNILIKKKKMIEDEEYGGSSK